jgi:DNA-directed RNA polymerase subunit RPC12/RpoP
VRVQVTYEVKCECGAEIVSDSPEGECAQCGAHWRVAMIPGPRPRLCPHCGQAVFSKPGGGGNGGS